MKSCFQKHYANLAAVYSDTLTHEVTWIKRDFPPQKNQHLYFYVYHIRRIAHAVPELAGQCQSCGLFDTISSPILCIFGVITLTSRFDINAPLMTCTSVRAPPLPPSHQVQAPNQESFLQTGGGETNLWAERADWPQPLVFVWVSLIVEEATA